MGYKYSSKVTAGLKHKVKKEIIDAVEGNPEFRKEIRRVFQMANRRIQNIEKSDLFSPAVASAGKKDVKGYSKFSIKGYGNSGESWTALKREYANAIAFLQQPTSTASGARAFEQQVKEQMNVDDKLWKAVRENLLEGYGTVGSQMLSALPYSTFMQEVYSKATQSASRQMEQDAKEIADNLQKNIEETAEAAAEAYEKMVKGFRIDI